MPSDTGSALSDPLRARGVARVAVFDSGTGSLSVVRAIRRRLRCELIYYADLAGYPYGGRSRGELARIVSGTVSEIRDLFNPDVLVMASNTPTLVLGEPRGVIGVLPPIRQALEATRTGSVAVLTTGAAARSRGLARYLSGFGSARIHKLDCTDLVHAAQSGRAGRAQARELASRLDELGVDAATLSSTHLALLRRTLEREMPGVAFLDPAGCVARRVASAAEQSDRASLKIYANADPAKFEAALRRLGVRRRVRRAGTRG